MTYKDRRGGAPVPAPWAVVRQGDNLQWVIIALRHSSASSPASSGDTRYKSRSDADGHLLLLRQRVPDLEFKVVFDLPDDKK